MDDHIISCASLEEKIGYRFTDRDLLIQAMTHTSYVNEIGESREAANERLEFLGDAVLELIVSDFLYRVCEGEAEGVMTKVRVGIVSEPALARQAQALALGDHLRIGRGEEKTGGRKRPSITSDAMEALIGALYLDGGMEAAKAFVEQFILKDADPDKALSDSKTALQEYTQAHSMGEICYRLIKAEGPDHERVFTMEAVIGGVTYAAGSGRSKKAAEQEAARATLLLINNNQES